MRYDIIKTENYLLVVDNSEIKEGDYRMNIQRGYVKLVDDVSEYYNQRNDVFKKVIAHLPLNSPILDGVDLLPPLEDEVEKLGIKDLESYYGSNLELTKLGKMWTDGFDIGHNKAKEKYKFSEEDLKTIFSKAWSSPTKTKQSEWVRRIIRERYDGSDRNGYEEMYPSNWEEMDYEERQEWFFQQELKSLTKYPIAFEQGNIVDGKNYISVTRRHDDFTLWIGKYIYS